MNEQLVAASTATAAHRRDHDHGGRPSCVPHLVEVIHLGRQAMAVCHDCCADTGFLPRRAAQDLAAAHRARTRDSDAAA